MSLLLLKLEQVPLVEIDREMTKRAMISFAECWGHEQKLLGQYTPAIPFSGDAADKPRHK